MVARRAPECTRFVAFGCGCGRWVVGCAVCSTYGTMRRGVEWWRLECFVRIEGDDDAEHTHPALEIVGHVGRRRV